MAATQDASPRAQAPSDPPAPDTGSVFDVPAERYQELGELGRGGMGRVVEAQDRALDRRVAIKHSLASSPHDVARFEREVRITARLQHPSIVPILDVGRDPDGMPFYIMRRIDGDPLSARVAAATTVRERLALVPALLGAIDAAAYAHASGVLHRDIKPSNILLGPYGETLLIDWGIAREIGGADLAANDDAADTHRLLTQFGSALGTPGYVAPEQARGEDIDARADVYSLGASLYYVLTGVTPFAGETPTVAFTRAAEGATPDLARIPEGTPAELVAIVTKALASAAADRYADAQELAADVRRFLAGQLVAAHVYTSRERLVRWVRRHRVPVVVGAIALVIVAVVSIVSVRRVIADRDRAERSSELAQQRADEVLIDRARSLLATDPTSAVAALRALRPEARTQPAVHAIARAAVGGGVERRIGQHATEVRALAFSPDGTRLVSASTTIMLHVLGAQTTRVLADKLAVREVGWRDDATVYYRTGELDDTYEIGTIDVATGARRPLAEPDARRVQALDGALIVQTAQGAIVRLAPDGTRTVLVESGVTGFATGAHRVVAFDASSLIVIGTEGTRVFPVERGHVDVVLSADGRRVARNSGGRVREWSTETGALLGQWQRPTDALNEIGYVDTTLYTWSSDGTGFMSLDGEPKPRWTTRDRTSGVFVNRILPFEGGALLANDSGGLALADAYGVAPIVHRVAPVTRAAIERRGRLLAIGTSGGDVLVMDLTPVRPEIVPMEPRVALGGVSRSHVLFLTPDAMDAMEAMEAGVLPMSSGPDGNGLLLELATGARTRVGEVTLLAGDLLVGPSPDGEGLVLRDTKLAVRGTIPATLASAFGPTAVYYLDRSGTLWKQPFSPFARPTRLGELPPGALDDAMAHIDAVTDDPIVVLNYPNPKGRAYAFEVTPTGLREIANDLPVLLHFGGRTRDGAWWAVAGATQLLLVRPGMPPRKIELAYPVTSVAVIGDQVRAFSNDRLTVLDARGTVLYEYRLTSRPRARAWTADTVLVGDVEGLVELALAVNVRRVLRATGQATAVYAPPDGREIFAVIETRTDARFLARWVDPTTADIGAHVDTLTNATLERGSDALRWE